MDVSKITDYLYIAARLRSEDAPAIRALDVGLIVSMIAERRPPRGLAALPVEVLWLRTVDFFLLPIPVRTLHRGVQAALPVIHDGHSVLVYCQGGRHRSVAMASAILIAMGHPADEAMDLVSENRAAADPRARHIQRQIRRYETFWQQHGQRST